MTPAGSSAINDSVVDANVIQVLPAGGPSPQILFESKFVLLALVSLKGGQRVEYSKPCQRLLTVAKGRVRLRGPGSSFVLQDGERRHLPRAEAWDIEALGDASLSLLIVK